MFLAKSRGLYLFLILLNLVMVCCIYSGSYIGSDIAVLIILYSGDLNVFVKVATPIIFFMKIAFE